MATERISARHLLRRLFIATLLLLLPCLGSSEQKDFVVGAYLPEYRFYIDTNATAPYLTDLIVFSIEASKYGLVRGVCCLSASHYVAAREAQAVNPRVKLWVSVGGAGRSNGFDALTRDAIKRSKFLENLKNLCLQEGLDGVDFDWEQPRTREEYNNYMELLLEASELFHESDLLVAVATRHLVSKAVAQTVDRIHLMAYNLGTSYHAEFGTVETFVKAWKEYPQHKIILGIPAYAQHMQTGQMDKTFSEIVDSIIEKEGSYQEGESVWNGYRFDSPTDVRRKVSFALDQGLGGIFFWELGQDKQLQHVARGGLLLQAARDEVNDVKSNKNNQEL